MLQNYLIPTILLNDIEIKKKDFEKTFNNPNTLFYKEAKKKYKNIKFTNEEKDIVESYKNKLKMLKKKLNERNIKPLFITQVKYEVVNDKVLFTLNEVLKEFCIDNKFSIIKLDELIDKPINKYFFDELHVTSEGSYFLAEKIFPFIKKELIVSINN